MKVCLFNRQIITSFESPFCEIVVTTIMIVCTYARITDGAAEVDKKWCRDNLAAGKGGRKREREEG